MTTDKLLEQIKALQKQNSKLPDTLQYAALDFLLFATEWQLKYEATQKENAELKAKLENK